jgi:hypothetical protein
LLQRLEFKRQLDNDTKSLKKCDDKKKSRLIITSKHTLPSDWVHHNQAGCSFWVHKTSGEVQTTPPHSEAQAHHQELPFSSSPSHPSFSVNTDWQGNDNDDTDATGSLVYDAKEYQDLMHVLGDP